MTVYKRKAQLSVGTSSKPSEKSSDFDRKLTQANIRQMSVEGAKRI